MQKGKAFIEIEDITDTAADYLNRTMLFTPTLVFANIMLFNVLVICGLYACWILFW